MRYIIVPPIQELVLNGEKIPYSIHDLNSGFVWPKPRWRNDADSLDLLHECMEAFRGKLPGDEVTLSHECFEIYSPFATLKGEPILNPAIISELTTIMRAVLRATIKPRVEPTE